ncbi:MAG: hypothetical protein ACRDKT_11450 [Actinomycetota bacterium]
MNRRPLVIALAIVGGLIVVVVVLLASGGAGSDGGDDPRNDVLVEEGPRPPRDTALADIRSATVTADGDQIVFSVVAGTDIPDEVPDGSIEWRWEVIEGANATWTLIATVDSESNASIVATTQDFSASTVDDSFPGEIDIDGSEVRVALDRSRLEGFPGSFEWTMRTTLDAVRTNTRSARASDRTPDEGSFRFAD